MVDKQSASSRIWIRLIDCANNIMMKKQASSKTTTGLEDILFLIQSYLEGKLFSKIQSEKSSESLTIWKTQDALGVN